MTSVIDLLAPDAAEPVAAVFARVLGAPVMVPFSARPVALLSELSRRMMGAPDLARVADAVALGYWLRPANLKLLLGRVRAPAPGGLTVPAGLAFHIPPANVDTMFVYSWAVGLLAGNRQIVRLSDRRGPLARRLLGLIGEAMAIDPELGRASAFLAYDHDTDVTAAISARADLRVIWGGDATVAAIRAVPLSPHAKEIVFADRLSLAVLDAAAVQALDGAALAALAGRLFGDILTFDQMGCSSPRLLFWVGPPELTDAADRRLNAAMRAEILRRNYRIPIGVATRKYAAACQAAIRHDVRAIDCTRTDWISVDRGRGPILPGPEAHPGAGLIYRARIDHLDELRPMIDRSVQTLVYFGIARDDLNAFAAGLCGAGIDRIVPVGQALAFDIVWDGIDLFDAFTRQVTLA